MMSGSDPEPLIRPIGMSDMEDVTALYREVCNAPQGMTHGPMKRRPDD